MLKYLTLYLLLVLFFSFNVLKSQNWVVQNSGLATTLNGIHFTDHKHGCAVGDNGQVITTADGGYHWVIQSSGQTVSFKSVCFIDNLNGWVAGANGTILHSSNGGITWVSQNSGTAQNLNGIFFSDLQHGWAVGNNGVIISTINGGSTWSIQSLSVTANFNAVFFHNNLSGYVIGASGSIYHSSDGGANWTQQLSNTTQTLYSASFADLDNGWAVGLNGTIVHTTNGGQNWVVQTSGTSNALLGICFSDAQNGKAVGLGGTILKTKNGGTNWEIESGGTTNNLRSISFSDAVTGWACGNSGTVLHQYEQSNICLVTVDTITGKNKIIWEKQMGKGIAAYNIYRLNGSVYTLLDSVPFNDLSEYLDLTSVPSQVANRYKISVVDSLGNESVLGPYHQTINLLVSQGIPTTTYVLSWNKYEDQGGLFVPDYYYLWRGDSPSNLALYDSVSASITSYNDLNVFSVYYYNISVKKPNPCIPTSNFKSSGQPYFQSLSNIENTDSHGIHELYNPILLKIFPNPSSQNIVILYENSDYMPYQLLIYDISGRIILEKRDVKEDEIRLDIRNLCEGIYQVEMVGKMLFHGKFVVNHN